MPRWALYLWPDVTYGGLSTKCVVDVGTGAVDCRANGGFATCRESFRMVTGIFQEQTSNPAWFHSAGNHRAKARSRSRHDAICMQPRPRPLNFGDSSRKSRDETIIVLFAISGELETWFLDCHAWVAARHTKFCHTCFNCRCRWRRGYIWKISGPIEVSKLSDVVKAIRWEATYGLITSRIPF
jgi:hypothetical protein